ncbi:MAG: hypothetical protein F8N15_00440 [Methanobacterium sp.]|nr:hypothetical protein [Methanobacterium sp.]
MASVTTTLASGGLAGAMTVIAVTELQRVGVTIGADEAAAIGVVVASLLHYVVRWLPAEKTAPPADNPQAPS